MEELREEACDCLFEIINKGMDPVDKTKLVESLCQVLQSAGFFNVEQVRLFLCDPQSRKQHFLMRDDMKSIINTEESAVTVHF